MKLLQLIERQPGMAATRTPAAPTQPDQETHAYCDPNPDSNRPDVSRDSHIEHRLTRNHIRPDYDAVS